MTMSYYCNLQSLKSYILPMYFSIFHFVYAYRFCKIHEYEHYLETLKESCQKCVEVQL